MNSTGQSVTRRTLNESPEMIHPVLEIIRCAEAAEAALARIRQAADQAHARIRYGGRLAEILLRLAEAKDSSYPHTRGSRNLNYLDDVRQDAARADQRAEKASEESRRHLIAEGQTPPRERPLNQDRYDELLDSVERQVSQIRNRLATRNRRRGLARALTRKPPRHLPYFLLTRIGRLLRWSLELHRLTAEDVYALQGLRHEDVEAGRLASEHRNTDKLRSWAARCVAHLDLPQEPATVAAAVEALIDASPLSAREWDDPMWDDPKPPERVGGDILLGRFHVLAPAMAAGLQPPASLRFPFRAGMFIDGTGRLRPVAVGLARSIAARMLAAAPAGRIEFTFIDPLSLGATVADFRHLADFGERLAGVSTATSARDIEERLTWLAAQVEKVNSTHLRGQFATIEAYNEHAGEVAESYHVLVVMDYPARFSESASQLLLSLAENGPPCGVHIIVVTNADQEQPRSLSLDRLTLRQHRVSWDGTGWQVNLASPDGEVQRRIIPDANPVISFDLDSVARSPAARLLVAAGRQAKESLNSNAVTLARLLPVLNYVLTSGLTTGLPDVTPPVTIDENDSATWWRGSTTQNVVAPIGLTGVRDVTGMHFSSTQIANGALMMGVPGVGKSTALHAAILTMCMLYGPEELELYLIDSKEGVEFKVYDHLPHARMVSIRSEREFAVSVLESISAKIKHRADLMKERAAGRANITEYRAATGDRLPRIVLIMDEFHELFQEPDRLGEAAFLAFAHIVRQGRFAGVHIVPVSQTLGGTPALDKSVVQLLAQRVAFQCRDDDAAIIMPDNPAAKLLTGQGNGLFNSDHGRVSHNRPFRGLYVAPDERDRILVALTAKATETEWRRRPRVFDGDSPASRPRMPYAPAGTSGISIPVGEPFNESPAFSVRLPRERGANVLITGEAPDGAVSGLSARGALHSCILAAALAGATVSILDFIGADEQVKKGLTIKELRGGLRGEYGVEYAGPDGAPKVLYEHAVLATERVRAGNYSARAHVLVVFGLHRAYRIEAPEYRSETGDFTDLSLALATIVRNGPAVGVHAVVSCGGTHTIVQRLGRDARSDFSLRIATDSTTADDLHFTADTHGTVVRPRPHQLLVGDRFTGTTTRVRGYTPLTAADIADL